MDYSDQRRKPQEFTSKLRFYGLEMLVLNGKLAEAVIGSNGENTTLKILGKLIRKVLEMAFEISLDMDKVVKSKMKNNSIKYPVEECLTSKDIQKYTAHSSKTGITDDSRMMVLDKECNALEGVSYNRYEDMFKMGISTLEMIIYDFANDRNWLDKYTATNTLLALSSEIGELLELFHWYPSKPGETVVVDRERLAGEMADVLIYCFHYVRLANSRNEKIPIS